MDFLSIIIIAFLICGFVFYYNRKEKIEAKIAEHIEVDEMSELTKKLRYQTNSGTSGAITLYTTASEAGSNYINLKVDNISAFAALGSTTDSNASHMRVTKGGSTYSILTKKPSDLPIICDENMPYWNTADNLSVFGYTIENGLYSISLYSDSLYSGGQGNKLYGISLDKRVGKFEQARIIIESLGIDEILTRDSEGDYTVTGLQNKYNITTNTLGMDGEIRVKLGFKGNVSLSFGTITLSYYNDQNPDEHGLLFGGESFYADDSGHFVFYSVYSYPPGTGDDDTYPNKFYVGIQPITIICGEMEDEEVIDPVAAAWLQSSDAPAQIKVNWGWQDVILTKQSDGTYKSATLDIIYKSGSWGKNVPDENNRMTITKV